MNDLGDLELLKEKMHAADIFCDATGVGMHPLEDLSNIPDPSYFKKDLIVTDTVYAPRETVMMKQAKEAGCEKSLQWYEHDAVPGTDCYQTLHWKKILR